MVGALLRFEYFRRGVELPYTIESSTADVFDTTLIGKARRIAQRDELTAVKPIRIDERKTYVMVIDSYPLRDLRREPK